MTTTAAELYIFYIMISYAFNKTGIVMAEVVQLEIQAKRLRHLKKNYTRDNWLLCDFVRQDTDGDDDDKWTVDDTTPCVVCLLKTIGKVFYENFQKFSTITETFKLLLARVFSLFSFSFFTNLIYALPHSRKPKAAACCEAFSVGRTSISNPRSLLGNITFFSKTKFTL